MYRRRGTTDKSLAGQTSIYDRAQERLFYPKRKVLLWYFAEEAIRNHHFESSSTTHYHPALAPSGNFGDVILLRILRSLGLLKICPCLLYTICQALCLLGMTGANNKMALLRQTTCNVGTLHVHDLYSTHSKCLYRGRLRASKLTDKSSRRLQGKMW